MCAVLLWGQEKPLAENLRFEADFRFRVEHDWDVRTPSGEFLPDRSRLRYRVRAGLSYTATTWLTMGMRLRTGDPRKQQDPQITLGDEFSGIPVSFEKAYAGFNKNWFHGWLGKNTFPFLKHNELFWSDNVFPEGVAIGGTFPQNSGLVSEIGMRASHFIFITNSAGFGEDSYVQGLQAYIELGQDRFKLFPAFYYFRQMPDIPDGNETFRLNYKIGHLGMDAGIWPGKALRAEIDLYHNFENLGANDSIPVQFRDQKNGLVLALRYGDLTKKGNWHASLTYTHLERFAAVDYLAQNDWARWDYSSLGSPDGRLTNMKGFELVVAYAINPKIDLQMRTYLVKQLVAVGAFTETNSRIRFDINIRI